MPRKKPASAKQRKAQLQEKRAIKRGDHPPPDPSVRRTTRKQPGHGRAPGQSPRDPAQTDKVQAARKLQSAFMKPSSSFLDLSKRLAASVSLPRPISSDASYLSSDIWDVPDDLGCPRRPKWRFDMTKKEVEVNEERQFNTWLESARGKVEKWRGVDLDSTEDRIASGEIKSPSYFELNLEVWRQLWRVAELSSILLVLLDSRCPPLHIPPSLHSYITSLKPARQIIFVLTKTGVVGAECSASWKSWLEARFSGCQVVLSESYRQKVGQEERKGQGSRKRHEPHIRDDLLASLVVAMKNAHQALLTPPEYLQSKPEKLSKWKPRVRQSVDWDAVLRSREHPELAPHFGAATNTLAEETFGMGDEEDDDSEKELTAELVSGPLTVGLIGQPNVGKSSLLNALFGQIRVKASRTPGKTKHFQTLFWTPEIRLVDCPGLVLPNYVPMEIQTLCSILPISQISSVPSCIRTLATLMPLEEIFDLKHPLTTHPEPAIEDKRTWRAHQKDKNAAAQVQSAEISDEPNWTAMDIMTAYALKKGWLTAKAGRPDINRAGNAILRAVAENRVRWAFWPPASKPVRSETRGIWIIDNGDEETSHPGKAYLSEEEDEASDEEDVDGDSDSLSVDEDESDSSTEGHENEGIGLTVARGGFGLLSLDEVDDEIAESDDSGVGESE